MQKPPHLDLETLNTFEMKGAKKIINEDGKNIIIHPQSPTGTESTNEE